LPRDWAVSCHRAELARKRKEKYLSASEHQLSRRGFFPGSRLATLGTPGGRATVRRRGEESPSTLRRIEGSGAFTLGRASAENRLSWLTISIFRVRSILPGSRAARPGHLVRDLPHRMDVTRFPNGYRDAVSELDVSEPPGSPPGLRAPVNQA